MILEIRKKNIPQNNIMCFVVILIVVVFNLFCFHLFCDGNSLKVEIRRGMTTHYSFDIYYGRT
jgi:hypothetical protein